MTDGAATIRWAVEQDLDGLVSIYAQEEAHNAAFLGGDAFEPTPPTVLEARLRSGLFGSAGGGRALIAEDAADGIVAAAFVGVLTPGWRARPGWFLKMFYVSAGHRGRGLGSEMVSRLIDAARDGGADRLELHVMAANDGARRFYARHGLAEKADRFVARIDLHRDVS